MLNAPQNIGDDNLACDGHLWPMIGTVACCASTDGDAKLNESPKPPSMHWRSDSCADHEYEALAILVLARGMLLGCSGG